MADEKAPLRLDSDDLYSPKVEAYLDEQQVLRRAVPEAEVQPLWKRILFASWFYLAIAGGLGAFAAWAILEPFFIEPGEVRAGQFPLGNLFLFPAVAGSIGMLLGFMEGLMCRNFGRAFTSAAVGAGIGFLGGFVSLITAGILFQISARIALALSGDKDNDGMPRGLGFLALMMGRGAAWALAAIPAGLGQGIALRDKKLALNGLLGGVLGGLLGGMMFDPISLVFHTASVSRCVGFVVIGLMVGLFVGLVEQWTKSAWLVMKAGPLAGKQFILYRNPTVLGSSPKADVYLFKDDAIEPQHALIHNRGGRFEIEDRGTPDGTYVNGAPVKKKFLENGDQIVLGKTVLEFSLRDKGDH